MFLTLNTESGVQSIENSTKFFSETFGPVSKGFNTSISATTNYPTIMNTAIYVCKGNEPFVLKATGGMEAEYVIDF
jgi:hypothetical protein